MQLQSVLSVGLLGVAIVGVFIRPKWLPACGIPVAAALVALLTGVVSLSLTNEVARSLAAPLGFLVTAVPVAVLLDRIGLFQAGAAFVDGGPHLLLGLWVLAAVVTTVLNLDASVVLLTPLYIRVAQRNGINPLVLAVQPLVLASLASSALPVSNLTNLIAAEQLDVGVVDTLRWLGLPSLVACVIGFVSYRRWSAGATTGAPIDEPVDMRALSRGLPVVAVMVLGFTLGDRLGIKPVFVSAAALVWLLLTVRDRSGLPIAWDPVLLALALAVLAGAVVERVDIGSVMPDGSGPVAVVMTVVVSMIAACAINNLPALLVLLPAAGAGGPGPWAVLLGVNMGPSFVITGALAGLLWRDTARRLGVEVSVAEFSRLGLRIAGPAVVGAVATFAAIAIVVT